VVDSLELVQAFVKISFTATAGPQQVPLVRLCVLHAVGFADRPHQLRVALEDFVEQLTVINMVGAGSYVAERRSRRRVHHQVFHRDRFEIHQVVNLAFLFSLVVLNVFCQWAVLGIKAAFAEEVLASAILLNLLLASCNQERSVVLDVGEERQHLFEGE
jgi:hypothetical protein